jgi:hypothetical protein
MSHRQRGLFTAALDTPELGLFTVPVRRPPTPEQIATGGFGYRPPLPGDSPAHTFACYLAGGRETTREVELAIPAARSQ